MSIENFNYQFCVECGNPDIREPFNDGHKQCNDRSCLQEFFDDVDYGDILVFPSDYVKKLSSELATANAEIEKLKKALEIAKKGLLLGCHILNEEEADIAMEKSQKALEEINEVLGNKVRP